MTERPANPGIPAEAVEDLRRIGVGADEIPSLAGMVARGPDPAGTWERLVPILEADVSVLTDPILIERAYAIAANSRALSRIVARHPSLLSGSAPHRSVALSLAASLVTHAGDDLTGRVDAMEAIARFSDDIDVIVGETLDSARGVVAERHPVAEDLPFVVIAMGKWGARELNYSSDIDLVFVHDTVDGREEESRRAALGLASTLMGALSAGSFDGPGLVVDADLRPEGKTGPLSRSIDGYDRYYRQWGAPWELQALLKARAAVGDRELGARFSALVEKVVWTEGLDVEALRSIRKLKEQVESSATTSDIKRSRGGIRDVEFAIQLLQLVHGRLDPDLRVPATLDALEALHLHGFVADGDRQSLGDAYRFLRDLEHRVQLWDLQQTHTVPDDPEQLERIARSMGMTTDPVGQLTGSLAEVKAVVRDVHERLYFRPILETLVGSPSARLGVDQAALRLEALGFQDVNAASRALGDLTEGLTRRSQAMHQVLPLMLDWLSLTPNPDLGLAQLRTVLARSRDHSSLVTLLQTNPLAGERLCRLLGTSRLLGNLIDRIPEFIPRLADDAKLNEIRDETDEVNRLLPLLDSRPEPDAKIGTLRRFARRRKLRIAARDILEDPPVQDTLRALTESADATVIGALHVAAGGDAKGFAVVAMGKWGGGELSYGSDLDLMYVFDEEAGREDALRMAAELAVVLSQSSRHGEAYSLDAGLRPEGRKGPLARSLDSYRRYYEEWAEPWEMMALVKARPVGGDGSTGSRFLDVVGSRLWRSRLPADETRAIRQIKARVEKERIPADEDPDYHLKLGPGAISDVEFLTQLLQLQHGGEIPALRVTGTMEALSVLGEAGLLPSSEVRSLTEAYLFCTRIRLRLHLQAGRAVDSLPPDLDDLRRLSGSLGYSRSAELREDYRRLTRRSRRIFERRFFE